MPNSYSLGRNAASQARTRDLELPSFQLDEEGNTTTQHNVCKIRVMDPMAMMTAGLLDDFDSLTSLVQMKMEEVDGKTVPSAEAIRTLAGMTDRLTAGMDMVDRLVEAVVVEPKVVWPVHRWPANHTDKALAGKPKKNPDGSWMRLGPDERDPDVLYTDDVDLEDRMFIMQYAVGGVSDPRQFRSEYTGLLDTVADGPGLSPFTLGDPSTH